MESGPGIIFTVGTFLLLLSILVFVHEWGHYIVARIFGVKVETFSIGFGREIFGWNDKKGTRWKISWLPLGGYVKFFGDATAISNPAKYLKRIAPEDRDGCFHFKPVWQRMLVVAAGPVINLVLAVFIFAGMNLYVGEYRVIEPIVAGVTEGTPADQAGIQPGDRVTAVNGDSVRDFRKLSFEIQNNPGREVFLEIDRGGQTLNLTVIPKTISETDSFGNVLKYGQLGISAVPGEIIKYNLFTALGDGAGRVVLYIGGIADFLGRIVTGQATLDEVGGPVKIAQFSGQAANAGLFSYIGFMAGISVILGFMNLLPIPLLDGGHLMFYSIEAVKGSPVSLRGQELASMVGLVLVLGLLFIVTWNDLKLPGLG